MSMHHDPELDDVLQDDELVRIANLLKATRRAEPPLDEAFRSALRRQLMQQAWGAREARTPWWSRLAAPPSMAWVGAAAGVVLIASVVVFMAYQQPGQNDLVITSPIADAHAVQLQQPILVSFNQPMDHPSTEAAVQIEPATYVSFSWSGNTLAVHPRSGNLAPNTQYEVTIGPGARTRAGQLLLARPKVITFVTQPSSPVPSPRPTSLPTPTSLLNGEHRLADLPTGISYTPQWSADSSTIYFVGDNGALQAVHVNGRAGVVVPDGVSYPAIAPVGDRIAYVRGGKIEILTLATGSIADLTSATDVTALSWAGDQLLWAAGNGIFKAGSDGPVQVASIPRDFAGPVSISPDGTHAAYQGGQSLMLLDLATSTTIRLGASGGTGAFLGWSPDGSRVLYKAGESTVVADTQGQPIATFISGDSSWSSQDVILVGTDTELYAVRPDGSERTRLSAGTYRSPVWAPNGTTFAFVRGGALWSANATPLPGESSALDLAAAVVSSFMTARLNQQPIQAMTYLDDSGKQAYSTGGVALLIRGDARFSRYYVVTQEITGSRPATARFVVRLVLTKGARDVSEYEETLILQRELSSQPFLIDQATAGPTRDLGRGAVVVGVEVGVGTIKVAFDSDLVPETVPDGVVLLDGSGKRVGGRSTYANRTATITGLQLAAGASYKLVVLTSVQDVSGRNVASEYDLNLVGPDPVFQLGGQGTVVNPSPGPGIRPSPSPVRSHTP